MFFGKSVRPRLRTLTFRLTLRFAILFAFLSLAVFGVAYYSLRAGIMEDMDDFLSSEAQEFRSFSRNHNSAALRTAIRHEAEHHGVDVMFIRLFSPFQDLVASSDLESWTGLEMNTVLLQSLSPGEEILRTIMIPGRLHPVRTLYLGLEDGSVIQTGHVVRLGEIWGRLGGIFIVSLLVLLFCGSLMGWLIVHRAMTGVDRVTRAAVRLGDFDFTQRLPAENKGVEIDRLAAAFNDMLEKIHTAVGELKEVTDNVAHDLRSPLNRIRGMAETTLTGNQSLDEWQDMAGRVIEECDQLVGLINTMLEIAEANVGLRQASATAVDVNEITARTYELYNPAAEDAGIEMSVTLPPEPHFTRGDPAKLKRVLANLLDNAVKFTPAGGNIHLSVSGSPEAVEIEVADSGPGIAEKNLARVFDRFFRGDSSRTSPGNGLGLSLVRAVARAHGGDVSVKSIPGAGSSFTLTLPRLDITKR